MPRPLGVTHLGLDPSVVDLVKAAAPKVKSCCSNAEDDNHAENRSEELDASRSHDTAEAPNSGLAGEVDDHYPGQLNDPVQNFPDPGRPNAGERHDGRTVAIVFSAGVAVE